MAKRRGKGEGSIIQLSDGRWRAYLTVGYGPNGPQRKYFYAKTRREVQDKLADAGQNQRKGRPRRPTSRHAAGSIPGEPVEYVLEAHG